MYTICKSPSFQDPWSFRFYNIEDRLGIDKKIIFWTWGNSKHWLKEPEKDPNYASFVFFFFLSITKGPVQSAQQSSSFLTFQHLRSYLNSVLSEKQTRSKCSKIIPTLVSNEKTLVTMSCWQNLWITESSTVRFWEDLNCICIILDGRKKQWIKHVF